MIYLDTSSLLKLLYLEAESAAVGEAVARESDVILSSLTCLEARIQLKAGWHGGDYSRNRFRAFVERLDTLADQQPFRRVDLGGTVFDRAIRQDAAALSVHLRTLDRLHLAAMEEMGVTRLMTNDAMQAAAAKAMGLVVMSPT